ncbi:putative protein TPRXL [Gigantopelta aegis]|uniref:putative protein TPRXL n=1 Tax=Gigantopelta aegis TaxID=1735272 RepID=UPI001B88C8E6|nr:putative protein TPRXL [Gigantopelta aegis]
MEIKDLPYLHNGSNIYDLVPAFLQKSLESTLASNMLSTQKPEMCQSNPVSPASSHGITMIKSRLSLYFSEHDTSKNCETKSALTPSSSQMSFYHEYTAIQCGSYPVSPVSSSSRGIINPVSPASSSNQRCSYPVSPVSLTNQRCSYPVSPVSSTNQRCSYSVSPVSSSSQELLSLTSQHASTSSESDCISKCSSNLLSPTSSVPLIPSSDCLSSDFDENGDGADTDLEEKEVHIVVPNCNNKGNEQKKSFKSWLLKLMNKKKKYALDDKNSMHIPALVKLL